MGYYKSQMGSQEGAWIYQKLRKNLGSRQSWILEKDLEKPLSGIGHKEKKGVETRPIMSGNFDEQPAMRLFSYRKVGDLPNSRIIMRNSFFFGNHPGITQEEREAIVEYFKEFIEGV